MALRARLHQAVGGYLYELGDPRGAQDHQERALRLFEEDGDTKAMVDTTGELGVLVAEAGDTTRGLQLLQETVDLTKRQDNKLGYAKAVGNLGYATLVANLPELARPALDEASLCVSRDRRSRGLGINLLNLGDLLVREGDPTAAVSAYGEALEVSLLIDNERTMALCLEGLVRLLRRGENGRPRSACLRLPRRRSIWSESACCLTSSSATTLRSSPRAPPRPRSNWPLGPTTGLAEVSGSRYPQRSAT